MNTPEIGTTMYHVKEHFYYPKGQASPEIAYCVCAGTVTDLCAQRHELRIVGRDPYGFPKPSYFRTNEIGNKVFYNEEEATVLARKLNEIGKLRHV